MGKWLITEKKSNQRNCKSLKGQGLAKLIVLASYLSDFTHKITECSKQELTSYMCNITINLIFTKRTGPNLIEKILF